MRLLISYINLIFKKNKLILSCSYMGMYALNAEKYVVVRCSKPYVNLGVSIVSLVVFVIEKWTASKFSGYFLEVFTKIPREFF